MRKLIVTEFITLDGVIQDPHHWSFPYWSDAIGEFKYNELFACDALLLGRVTYQGFAEAWPSRTDEAGFADRINSIPKYVASTTLTQADWNNSTIIKGNVAQEVAKLKQMPGQDITIHGSGQLIRSLMPENLIDQYQLLVYPIVRGQGQRLFTDGASATLTLVESRPMGLGVVLLSYAPGEQPEKQ